MFKTLPGFREFYPAECAEKAALFDGWRRTAKSFGFAEFEPPVLEQLDLFTEKSGEEIKSQLFEFVDKGGRAVALRPEMTPSLARMAGARAGGLRRPVKWFAIGENYRYERQQKGRLRAFYQFNADILGEESVSADAEAVALLIESLRAFGLTRDEFRLRLGDRNLWVLFLEGCGVGEDFIIRVLSVVDKIEKVSPAAFSEMMAEALSGSGCEPSALVEKCREFVAVKSLEGLKAAFGGADGDFKNKVEARLSDWDALIGLLGDMGVAGFVNVDMGIVRGLAYYTGFVFEAFQTVGTGRALAGGGRYDSLVKKLGFPDMPAVGFGMGDVTVSDLLKLVGKMPEGRVSPDVYAVIGSESLRGAALGAVSSLRRAGIGVEYPFRAAGFGKQFKAADACGARFAVIFGEDEMAGGCVKVKDLKSGSEEEVPLEKLSAYLLEAKKAGL